MSTIKEDQVKAYLIELWAKEYPNQPDSLILSETWAEQTVSTQNLIASLPRDMKKARKYLKWLREGTVVFPPLVCINGEVIDGMHRFWAYTHAGFSTVRVYQNLPWRIAA